MSSIPLEAYVRNRSGIVLASVVLFILAAGCSSSNSSDAGTDPGITPDVPVTTDPGPGDVTPTDTPQTDVPKTDVNPADVVQNDVPVGGDLPSDPGTEIVTAQLTIKEVSMSGDTVLPGVLATLVSSTDGTSLGQSATSDSNGQVTFQVQANDRYAVKLTMASHLDSYTFNLNPTSAQEDANILSQTTADAILGMLSVTQDSAKGIVAGGVDYVVDGSGGGAPVGCAAVESVPATDIYYFGSSGPMTHAQQSSTSKSKSDFLAFNVPTGSVAFTAKVNGTQVAAGTGLAFANAISFRINVQGSGAANPTPADCAQ